VTESRHLFPDHFGALIMLFTPAKPTLLMQDVSYLTWLSFVFTQVVVELITGRSVWGQLIGRDGPPSILLLGLTIVTVFVSSFAPRVRDMPDNGLDR
jgi:hypothetical protein